MAKADRKGIIGGAYGCDSNFCSGKEQEERWCCRNQKWLNTDDDDHIFRNKTN